jgi:hypothetical protein
MFNVRNKVVFSLAVALVAASAFAGDKPGTTPGKITPISWDELKERCLHPRQFENQAPIVNAQIECTDTSRSWAAAAPGEVALPGYRKITTRVTTDKFAVAEQESELEIPSKGGSCQRFKEIEQTLTIEVPVSCDQILGHKGTLAEFCSGELDKSKGANPKLVQTKDTGNMLDTCGGTSQDKPGSKPGDKK